MTDRKSKLESALRELTALMAECYLTNESADSVKRRRAYLRADDLCRELWIYESVVKIGIKNRWDGSVLFAGEYASTREALEKAIASRADLSGAYLSGTNLKDAKDAATVVARTRILPEGDLIGWKKTEGGIVKLRIPSEARRSHAFGRKCRAEFVDVLEAPEGAFTSAHGPRTEYKTGERVKSDAWDENWMEECSHGIHFFITREEAEAY